jgi:type IV pilus assembly protein PilY1
MKPIRALVQVPATALALLLSPLALPLAQATTPLADQPVFSAVSVPGNLALALSVEFPTIINAAYPNAFVAGTRYLGYFDHAKCYRYYRGNATHDAARTGDDVSHFFPVGDTTADFKCTATGRTDAWSGSFLNWMTMQGIDSFRWALTGGYRRVDTNVIATSAPSGLTVLERAWSSNQGGEANFIVTGDGGRASPSAADIADHTPLSWTGMRISVRGRGNQVWFTQTGTALDTGTTGTPNHFDHGSTPVATQLHFVYARVRVCDGSSGAGPMESNCTAYPSGTWKPTGLIHEYADRFRYSAFGYLNDSAVTRDGAALRARQKFVGPEMPRPGTTPTSNAAREWDPDTGIFIVNPDPTDASATNTAWSLTGSNRVTNSGVINYLNKFGQTTTTSHKTYDPVGELYYAAVRYFKNLGNVPAWTATGAASETTRRNWADGFPVITSWDDPIQYSCQRNFVLGIGDVNSHADKNVPGTGIGSANEPTRPTELALDPVNAKTATDKVGELHGLGSPALGGRENYGGCCTNNSALMAGIAYDSNTRDIRPDDLSKPQTKGKQTIQTYWLDVLEYGVYKNNNQFYLAAKYGGFKVPTGFDPYTRSTDIDTAWWRTTTDTTPGGQPRPDNYYTARDPETMINGLNRAFKNIADALRAYTTSFATSLPQTTSLGSASFGARYDAGWTGEVEGNLATFDATTGDPLFSSRWSFASKLTAQIAESSGTGWNTSRNIVSWRVNTTPTAGAIPSSIGAGVRFRTGTGTDVLSSAQQSALDTVYRTGVDSVDFLNYLRGDRTHEVGSPATGSARIYRERTGPVGDIVGSRVEPVGPPSAPFSNAANPGYSSFRSTWASRPTMVYVGSNAGMLHAINGSITDTSGGRERWAYVPDMVFNGPSGAGGASTHGLAARGDPDFTHRAMVDGSAASFDIDLGRTMTDAGTLGSSTNWRTVLVGSMGKGGRGYFAIDITDPATMTSEAAVAGRVMWEISSAHPDFAELGFTFGEPAAVKLRKYGWVLIFASGHNNSDGKGWFFIVNPRNGKLLEKISTGVGSPSGQAGMAHVQALMLDRTDGTADAVYAGDLLGNLWRWDVRATTGAFPAPTKLAELTNAAGDPQPVTSRPYIIVHPATNRRYVTVGTGRLLAASDISNSSAQSFYAIQDGSSGSFASTGPAGASFPIVRTQLAHHTDLTRSVTVESTQGGWWVNLGTTAGNGWRVITEPSGFYGVVTFAAMLPDTSNPCEPSGRSRLYSVDVASGRSRLIVPGSGAGGSSGSGAGGTVIAYSESIGGVVIEHQTRSVDAKPRLIACNDLGECKNVERDLGGMSGLRRLNWRELPLAD